jgi:hypothetical protein
MELGTVMKENRPVQGFTEVELAMMGTLHLTQGDAESLMVEAEDDLLPKIVTTVQRNRLTIRLASGTRITTKQPVDFSLTMKEITGISLSSSGSGTLDQMNTDALAFDISGSLAIAQVQTQTR